MGLRINTNVQSLSSQHRLEESQDSLKSTQNRLSSGSRINRPMDDAAGLAISESLRATMRATGQNIKNAHDGFYVLQTADGALNEMTNIVIRMKELATQASSDTNGDRERLYLDKEYQQLKQELDRISETTLFNGRPLLNGDGGEISIQVGPNNSEEKDRILVSSNFEVNLGTLGLSDFQIGDADGARGTLEQTQRALDKIADVRGEIGAGESRLNSSISALKYYEENTSAAYSQIRDADIAHETSELTKYNILSQAGAAILAQANSTPQLALKLLG
ncbi:MAG: flagellin FliC [Proteobacteria bacterium]|nr:flagellin FliC [Pseudomonadota bacterium]